MLSLNRRRFLHRAILGSAAVLAMPALIRTAQAKTPLTIASLFGDDKPETKIWLKMRDLAEAKLPNQFRFNIVKNSALGGEKAVAEGIRLGSIQGSLSTMSALSGWVPEVQILDMPFLFKDADHVLRTVQGATGEDLKTKLKAQNFIITGFINYGARHLLTKEPVTRPEQLQGKRIRVIQSPLHTKLWSNFGTTPVGIPITETYNALQTGVADAMDLTKSAYAGFKLYEVVPCLTQTAHIHASGVIYFAAPFWNSLNPEQQAVLQEASTEATGYFNQLMTEDEKTAMKTAQQYGGQVLRPEDYDKWQAGAKTVWEDFAPVVGGMEHIRAIQAL